MYESTGIHKPYNSWIAEVELESGKQEKKVELDPAYFGEGITILNNKIYQLSWKSKLVLFMSFQALSISVAFRTQPKGGE